MILFISRRYIIRHGPFGRANAGIRPPTFAGAQFASINAAQYAAPLQAPLAAQQRLYTHCRQATAAGANSRAFANSVHQRHHRPDTGRRPSNSGYAQQQPPQQSPIRQLPRWPGTTTQALAGYTGIRASGAGNRAAQASTGSLLAHCRIDQQAAQAQAPANIQATARRAINKYSATTIAQIAQTHRLIYTFRHQ